MNDWAKEEAKTADLGDERLNNRFAIILEQLGSKPQLSIPTACGGWSETIAAYRFFDNQKTSFEQILKAHQDATIARIKVAPVVLLAQDTTENDERITLGPKGLGTLKNSKKMECRLHPTIAFTPEKICLGVVKADYWQRQKKSPRNERRNKGIDEKESGIWIESYQESCALQGLLPDSLLVNISDREGDMYELFTEYHTHEAPVRAQFIVRAAQDRRLLKSENKLFENLENALKLGEIHVEVKGRGNCPGRVATLTLRSATITLKPPARTGYRLSEVTLNAVLAKEESPPVETEGLEWLLMTSLPVTTFEQASTVVEWYGVRWCIEIYFHVLKSGCQIEELQLSTVGRYLPCLAIYMIIAWRVLFTLMLGRNCPELCCEVLFEKEEWQAVYIVVKRLPPPVTPPSLGEIVSMVASLGGYLARKHDSPPGPKALWIGLQRLRDFVITLDAKRVVDESCV